MDKILEANPNSEDILLKIGSRDSILAMKQTNLVRDKLLKLHRSLTCNISSMKTLGDKILDVALSKIGSKSLFTKELEEALAQKCVHIVVHSLKDLPTTLPKGMVIGAVLTREDPRDAVLLHPRHQGSSLGQLPAGAVIGSSSVRRVAQLTRRFPSLEWRSVRGNLNTRLNKLDKGDQYDGLVLAAAGLHRMGWQDRVAQYLEASDCMYAVGQGALAVECLASDVSTLELLRPLCHHHTLLAAIAERALMAALEGGCSAPVAVTSQVEEDSIILRGGVWSLNGKEELIEELTVSLVEGEQSLNACADATDADKRINLGTNVNEGNSCSESKERDSSNGSVDQVSGARTVEIASPQNGSSADAANTARETANGTTVTGRDADLEKGPKRVRQEEPDSTGGDIKRHKADDAVATNEPETYSGIVPPPDLLPKARLAHALGRRLADLLLAKGAAKILAEAKAQNTVTAPNVKPAQQ